MSDLVIAELLINEYSCKELWSVYNGLKDLSDHPLPAPLKDIVIDFRHSTSRVSNH